MGVSSNDGPANLLGELLRGDPAHALEWVRSEKALSIRPWPRTTTATNLHRLAEGATTNALLEQARGPTFLWAETAIHAFGLIGEEERAMALRTLLVTRFGPKAHPLSDPGPILDWLKRTVRLTPEELAARTSDWKTKSRAEILELRQIKNRLSIVQRLAEAFPDSVDDETKELLDIRQRLP